MSLTVPRKKATAPPAAPPRQQPRRQRIRLQELRAPALLLLPTLVGLGAVSLYPIARSLWLSLRDTTLAAQTDSFVGLENFTRLADDGQFWNAYQQTLVFTAAATLLETLLGMGIALVLFETFRGRGMVRAAMLVPWAIPTVVTSRMFGWLFDGQNGVINYLLRTVGLIDKNVNWTGSVDHAMQTIIIADVWKTTPFMALLILAGLQTIPSSLSEAAKVDGAGAWQVFWRVRLPMVAPALLIAALLRALDSFRIFDLVYVLTGGGPADSTETLSTLSYKRLFSGLELGYGSAITTAMFLTEALIAVAFGIWLSRRLRATEA
jgi:ABC-type sugar transport system permease subunit